jgi:peroxiredoxin
MDRHTRKIGKTINHIIPLVLVGVGLIILGLAAAKVISFGGLSSDYSVVPSVVNIPAPELTLKDLQGKQISILDYDQQVVLINNWATWCPPCKAEMPTLSKYFKEHVDQGFILVGIEAGETADVVAKFVDENDLPFPILLDPDNKSLITFHNENLPNSYVIDRNGNVVLTWTGLISHAMLEKFVTPLLEQ